MFGNFYSKKLKILWKLHHLKKNYTYLATFEICSLIVGELFSSKRAIFKVHKILYDLSDDLKKWNFAKVLSRSYTVCIYFHQFVKFKCNTTL